MGILDSAGRKCAFLGIDESMHDAYILLNLETMRVVRSNDILAIKNLFGYNLKPIVPNRPVYMVGDTEIQDSLKSRTPTSEEIEALPEIRAIPPIPPLVIQERSIS